MAYNNRDHRKILIVDGQIAYTGGVNLADEYINHVERFGYWKDSGIRLDGLAVKALTRLFLTTWYINRGEISDFDQYHLENHSIPSDGLTIPYGSTQANFSNAGREKGLSEFDQSSNGIGLYYDTLFDHRL